MAFSHRMIDSAPDYQKAREIWSKYAGRRSCFYRAVPLGKAGAAKLEFREERVFDPKTAYPTKD